MDIINIISYRAFLLRETRFPQNLSYPRSCSFVFWFLKSANIGIIYLTRIKLSSDLVEDTTRPEEGRGVLSFCLSSPDILSNTFDPVSELVDASVPFLQSPPHAVDLLHVQYLGLDPVDARDLSDLVDATLQQTEG